MKRTKKRRRIFPRLLLTILALAGFLWWSNCTLTVHRAEFRSARLPSEFDGFTIIQLSDLHSREFGADNAALLERVAAEKPDMIALTGDLLDQDRSAPPGYALKLGEALAALAPTYFVTGNHEWARGGVPELKDTLRAAGVTVLSNQLAVIERDGAQIVVAGIDDPNGYADQKTPEETANAVYAQYGAPFWLLLAHRNERFATQYSFLGADLTLSGHAHGGSIRLPVVGGLFSHDGGLFPDYTAGFYEENGAALFVSRGLGNTRFAFRLFNRPEIAAITLRCAGET